MALFLQYVVNGLADGFVVGLMALSVVMVYRSTRVLSFAQGAIASLVTYVYYQLFTVWHLPVLVALLLSLIAAVATGAACDLLAMRPLRRADNLTRTVATLGIVLVLQVIMRVVWKGNETFILRFSTARFTVGRFTVGAQELITAAVALAAAALLAAWTRRTYSGLGLTAIAEDLPAARLLGVSPARSSLVTWSVSAALAGLAGILVTPRLVLNPIQMTLIMVTSYGAALAGGFTSLPIALGGALGIGVVSSIATGYTNVSGLSETIGFIAVFVVLLLTRSRRPLSSLLERESW